MHFKSPYSHLLCYTYFVVFISAAALSSCKGSRSMNTSKILEIEKQGSFFVGGTISTKGGVFNAETPTESGQTFHADHAYVFYQHPYKTKGLPIVMWHGIGQSAKTWETTPDGREGFQNIFLRKGYPVYLFTQPRRGAAGRSSEEAVIKPIADEQQWFGTFRLGIWPNYYPGVQFPRDTNSLVQYFRAMTPNIGPISLDVNVASATSLFEQLNSGILFTHSHSGGMGWLTALKSNKIKAIVSFEPGSGFLFPEGEVPQPKQSAGGTLQATGISLEAFKALTKIPILIIYGDFIPAKPSKFPGEDGWRVRLEMAREWQAVVNKYGGNVTVLHLPTKGIFGNTHFPFSDLNNIQIADLVAAFLNQQKLATF